MKIFLMILVSVIFTLSAAAQTITLTFNGTNRNVNYQVLLDGTSYYSNSVADPNNNNTSVMKEVTLANQQLGSHKIEIFRLRGNGTYTNGTNTTTNGRTIYSNTFQLRQGYDMDMAINGSGQVSITEKRIRNQGRRGYNQVVNPMDDDTFNQLMQNTRARWLQSAKLTAERDAFNNTANFFTTMQVRELLLLISSEANRLALAKLAYPRVTDPTNFTQLYNIFNSVASRNNMNTFIRNNPNNNNTNTRGNDNNNNNTYRTPMADYPFSQLLQTVNSQYSQSAKYTTITGAFNNNANYFSTTQIRQLLNVINSQNDRLTLAKQSYLRVSDAANFSSLYDLFYSQASRNDLDMYVIQNGGTSNNNNNTNIYRTAMADYSFRQLLQTINSQYNQTGKYASISGAFNNTANYFSTVQIRQLLSVIDAENDRLVLAKQSFLRVSDAVNFSSLYDLLYSQASRNDLNNYVIQNGGTSTYTNTQYTNRTPMSDATFSQELQKVSNHFFPWDKTRDAKAAFSTSTNYFTTSQIRQILTVIASETERLELAKLAWSQVTDPGYFTQLGDVFTNQAYKDDLIAYVQAHPF